MKRRTVDALIGPERRDDEALRRKIAEIERKVADGN
jgi:hypothetical protein